MCRRVLSLEEAYKICDGAGEAVMLCDQPVEAGESDIRGAIISSPYLKLASFEKTAGREISLCSMTEESLGELLTRMFVEADTEGKVIHTNSPSPVLRQLAGFELLSHSDQAIDIIKHFCGWQTSISTHTLD